MKSTTGSAALRALLGLAVAAAGAEASFAKRPYLQDLGDSTVVVRWETGVQQGGVVQYGLTAGYGLEVRQSGPSIDHELTLTGLLPDTLYHYRVISDADTSAGAAFRSMAGPASPFRFIAFGDPHGDSATNQRVADRMALANPGPAVIVCTGDLTPDSRSASYRAFFNTQRALLSRAPLFPALGNHDVDTMALWHRFFALPGNERWYSLRYGCAAFHCLTADDSFSPGTSQYRWLLAELQDDSASPAVRHVFIYIHTPAYSTNVVYSGNADVRQYLCPLFERFGVRVVFSGHVHAYEHSLVNGVHYLTTGGGGASLSTGWNSAQPWTVYREATYQFVLVDVRGDTVVACGVRPDGSTFDSLLLVRNPVGVTEVTSDEWRVTSGATIARGVLVLPRDMTGAGYNPGRGHDPNPSGIRDRVPSPKLLDAAGRVVMSLHSGANDVRFLPSGVYFLHSTLDNRQSKMTRVVVTR
jgi:hypothetical protein